MYISSHSLFSRLCLYKGGMGMGSISGAATAWCPSGLPAVTAPARAQAPGGSSRYPTCTGMCTGGTGGTTTSTGWESTPASPGSGSLGAGRLWSTTNTMCTSKCLYVYVCVCTSKCLYVYICVCTSKCVYMCMY